jgi:hypothetical protein
MQVGVYQNWYIFEMGLRVTEGIVTGAPTPSYVRRATLRAVYRIEATKYRLTML